MKGTRLLELIRGDRACGLPPVNPPMGKLVESVFFAVIFQAQVSANPETCKVGSVAFEGEQACSLVRRIALGEEVPFRPFAAMATIADICEALEGKMDERLPRDRREVHFRTLDGFDCYRKGEPIWLPAVRDPMYRPSPLIIDQPTRRFRRY